MVNTPTIVTFTVSITDPTLIPNSVSLLRLRAPGAQSIILGQMHDDGKNGDAVASDRTYTLQVSLNEPATGQIQLQVSAAFRGLLKRVTSTGLVIDVWNSFLGSTFQFLYPPGLSTQPASSTRPSATSSTSLTDPNLQSTVLITTYANSSNMDLGSWYAQVLEGNEYSGSFSRLGNAVDLIQRLQCNDSPGLLIKGEVFGFQTARLFCAGSSVVVEFEASTADGDEPPELLPLQLASTFKRF